MEKGVSLEKAGAIGWLRISNVARHNAMSMGMWQQLAAGVAKADADPEIRVIVLHGDGDRAFVSGADISEFGERADSKQASEAYSQSVADAETALTDSATPVIAKIRGICMGGGLGLAVSCDLRYAGHGARFRMPAARLGVGYDLANMRHIVDAVGKARAADLFYTARIFDGHEAQRIGLAHSAVPDAELDDFVQEMAEMIAANAPLTMRAAKLAIAAVDHATDSDGAAGVAAAVAACAASADYTEGRTAFMEKRPPQFSGR